MINDALTLEIFEALMAQDTINPPGNEKRGALCLKEIFDREGIPCEVQDLGDNRANFIASFGEGDKILEYSGHLARGALCRRLAAHSHRHDGRGRADLRTRRVRHEGRRGGHVLRGDLDVPRQDAAERPDPPDVCRR